MRWQLIKQGYLRYISFLIIIITSIFSTVHSSQVEKVICKSSTDPIDLVILLDVTTTNRTIFNIQRKRLIRAIEHIEQANPIRETHLSLIIFNREAVVVSALDSPHSQDFPRIKQFIKHVRPRNQTESSVARALREAADQFEKINHKSTRKLILLVHDGDNKDRVAESVIASNSLNIMNINVFAISGSLNSNHYVLRSYTGERERVLINSNDINKFYLTLDDALGYCNLNDNISSDISIKHHFVHGVRTERAEHKEKIFEQGQECGFEKVDLVIVIDTSGSVYSVFQEQRQIALELLNSFPESSFNEHLQVSIVRFAASSNVIKPLSKRVSRKEIIDIVNAIEFTGQQTRIAGAVQLAIEEIHKSRRADARQVFLLISDGHGQEYWSVVQTTGQQLQETGSELFAVSATDDYNEDELLIYVGHSSRLFVGPKYKNFIPTLSKYISDCIQSSKDNEIPSVSSHSSAPIMNSMEVLEEMSSDFDSSTTNDMISTSFESTTDMTETDEGSGVSESEMSTPPIKLILHEEVTSNPIETTDDEMETTVDPLVSELPVESFDTTTNLTPTEGEIQQTKSDLDISSTSSMMISETESPEPEATSTTELSVQIATEEAVTDVTASSVIDSTVDMQNTTTESVFEAEATTTSVDIEHTDASSTSTSAIEEASTTSSITSSVETATVQEESDGEGTENPTDAEVMSPESTVSEDGSGMLEDTESSGVEETTIPIVTEDISTTLLHDIQLPSHQGLCQIDLILVVDTSQSVNMDFQHEIESTIQVIEQFAPEEYSSGRIRVGISSFARTAQIEYGLSATTRGEVVKVLHDIEHVGGTTSSVAGVHLTLLRLISQRRPNARVVTLLFTDGHSQDYWNELVQTATRLQHVSNSKLLAFTASEDYSQLDLDTWTGSPSNVYSVARMEQFLSKTKELMTAQDCATSSENFNEKLTEIQQIIRKTTTTTTTTTTATTTPLTTTPTTTTTATTIPISLTTVMVETTEEDSTTPTETITEEPVGSETQRPARAESELELLDSSDSKLSVHLNKLEAADTSSECDIDLVLIIDVSLSVETQFDKQLEFAVDVIKRLPDQDVGSRVRVAIVLFNKQAYTPLHLNENLSKSRVLEELLKIKNIGGSTSVVTGVNAAIDEINSSKRDKALQIAILVSDGNSQDIWENVLKAASRLQATVNGSYAITVSEEYKIRELELYAGDKFHVYVEARRRQFIDEMETLLMTCSSSSGDQNTEKINIPEESLIGSTSCSQPVDLIFIIDHTVEEATFYRLKQYAIDLIRTLPSHIFLRRLSSSIIVSGENHGLKLALSSSPSSSTKRDILFELERLQHGRSTKPFTLSKLLSSAHKEFHTHGRNESRGVVIFLSSGDWSDSDEEIQNPLHELTQISDLLVISLADAARVSTKLRHLVAIDEDLYLGEKLDRFTTDVTQFIGACSTKLHAAKSVTKLESLQELENKNLINFATATNFKCKYHQIDLQIILDASSSREEVFEHQRELALSLVERLPISSEGTHVAIGINSFTSTPVLRQNLGLGRDKKIVRDVLENINYHGGSTLTAQAVELSIMDLERGRRPDAIQVVILMNDGISQDHWDRVVEVGKRLQDTGAEIFGVALGEMVDLRELHQYVPKKDRIYRDGSTERFLSDVVQLLKVDKNCDEDESQFSRSRHHLDDQNGCSVNPTLDLLFLFDNTDKSNNMKDPTVNSNRYLLLDVLGSLVNETHVRVSVLSLGGQPKIILPFTTISKRDRIFTNIEAIQATTGTVSYAEAVEIGLEMLDIQSKPDRHSAIVIVGDGNSVDKPNLKEKIISQLQSRSNFATLAVDSSTHTDVDALSQFTSNHDHVFNYDRNALFVEKIKIMAAKAKKLLPACHTELLERRAFAFKLLRDANTHLGHTDGIYSTIGPLRVGRHQAEAEEAGIDLTGEPIDLKSRLQDKKDELAERDGKIITDSSSELTTVKPKKIILLRYTKKAKKMNLTPALLSSLPATVTQVPTTLPITAATENTVTTLPSFAAFFHSRPIAKENEIEATTTFRPGCLFDVIMVLDASGSVEETFKREKELATGIMDLFRVGPENARFSLIKFAASHKVKTIWSLNDPQDRSRILRKLQTVPFTSGTTAIHAAILRAISEYTVEKGARPGIAKPVVIMFTDGFGHKSIDEESRLLRNLVPNTYAVAINHHYPISRKELVKITGNPSRVYTDANIGDLHQELKQLTAGCILD